MRRKLVVSVMFTLFSLNLFAMGSQEPKPKSVVVFDKVSINPNTGKSTYVNVDGYRYINIYVIPVAESEEKHIAYSLGLIYKHDQVGTLEGARALCNYENATTGELDPQFIKVEDDRNTITRVPIMGPYAFIILWNTTTAAQQYTIWVYLSQ